MRALATRDSIKVSIHAPTRGATYKDASPAATLKTFQSTHPHGVRPILDFRRGYCQFVSIHAPTRGATSRGNTGQILRKLFQSTHPHGVRHCVLRLLDFTKMFQSTHPHGVRRKTNGISTNGTEFQSTHPHGVRLTNYKIYYHGLQVSIHAPTRGATSLQILLFRIS